MKVLVVEDEPGVARFIQQGLTEEGYIVDVARDGQEGLDLALAIAYDVIVLDIMLPKMSGLEMLREIRDRRVDSPVLLLTARQEVKDRVLGLDSGADDYLVKPFSFQELLARVRALLRRPPLQIGDVLRMDDLEMNTLHREVRRAGKIIDLSPHEFSLLEFLLRHPNQVLTRTQILEHVWNYSSFNDSNVADVYIGYLRRKIDWDFPTPLIHTVRGVGYRLSREGDDD